jgi:hypothetical protein
MQRHQRDDPQRQAPDPAVADERPVFHPPVEAASESAEQSVRAQKRAVDADSGTGD